jgi:hypothetical protein
LYERNRAENVDKPKKQCAHCVVVVVVVVECMLSFLEFEDIVTSNEEMKKLDHKQ